MNVLALATALLLVTQDAPDPIDRAEIGPTAGEVFEGMDTQAVTDTIDVCQRAQVASFAGDDKWLERYVAKVTPGHGLVIATICLAYAKGVFWGVQLGTGKAGHPKYTPAAR